MYYMLVSIQLALSKFVLHIDGLSKADICKLMIFSSLYDSDVCNTNKRGNSSD